MPGRDRRLCEPHRQAPPLAQGSIVFGPVHDPALLFWDAVTASRIGLERHGGSRVTEGGILLRQPSPDANRPIRATNSRGSSSAEKCSTSFSTDIAVLSSLTKGEP